MHQGLHLPPFLGMMTGLGASQSSAISSGARNWTKIVTSAVDVPPDSNLRNEPFDIFISIKRVEWDTLLFFYGVILCVGALAHWDICSFVATTSYGRPGPTSTCDSVPRSSTTFPIMFAVLTMRPEMSEGQWLLVTLTAGVGGSLVSIGSAAGVALMGQARGSYTFLAHLRWSWAIALGYAASIWTHLLMNAGEF